MNKKDPRGHNNLMTLQAKIITEGKTSGDDCKKLCKEPRRKLQAGYEEYKGLRLREAAEKRRSLKKVERELRARTSLLGALKDRNGRCTAHRTRKKEGCETYRNDLFP